MGGVVRRRPDHQSALGRCLPRPSDSLELRAESLEELDALVADGDLDSRGSHPALGEVTLRELLATWAVHDLDHTSQVFAGMAGAYDRHVGAWKRYLGILRRGDDPAAVAG